MKFQNKLKLLGVVGKKGSGRLDNGNEWSTDRVELHCYQDFDSSDAMSSGGTSVIHNVQNFAMHYELAKTLVSKDILIDFEMVAAKKAGQAPKLVALGFSQAK